MSFQTFVTERLAAITTALNAIGINAKKIDELPIQSNLDPASKIHVSRGGTSESLTIQKIVDSVVDKTFSQLTNIGEITVSGLVVNVPSGASWVYGGINYSTLADTNITETLCEVGYLRKDILVANQLNQIVLVKGNESLTIRIKPNTPIGTIFVTEIDVDDTVIGTPTVPVIGEHTMSKLEKIRLDNVNGTGSYEDWTVGDQRSCFNFSNAVTEFKSFHYHPDIFAYDGKIYTFKNSQATPVTLFHNAGTGIFNFRFPNAVNFVLHPNEVIEFRLNYEDTAVPKLEYIGIINSIPTIEIADVTGLPAALDLKLNVADYNQHFKGVYLTEAALNAAHPTGVAGDTAQVNEVGSTDVVNYSWDAEENIWVNNGTGGSGAVNTDTLPEGTSQLYFQTARVLATLLTGISFVTGGAIVSTDSVLVAFGKLQKQISDALTAIGLKSDINSPTFTGTPAAPTATVGTNTTQIATTAFVQESKVLPVTEIGTSFSLTDAYNGKVVILTASCAVTIPNGLIAGFECSFATLTGVTLTVALGGSVVLFNNAGTTMAEKLSFTLKNRTATNNYITAGNSTYQYQLNDLYKMFKDNAIYTKIQAFHLYLGTTSTQHKWNGKNPVDTDAGFRLTFLGTGTYTDLGYTPNGSSGYANTHFIPSAVQNVNSNGMTIVIGTNNAAAGSDVVDFGSQNSGTQSSFITTKNNNTTYQRATRLNATVISQNGVNNSKGIFTGTKQSATVTKLIRNGIVLASGNSGGTLTTLPGYVGALNLSGSAYGFTNQRIQATFYHEGFSDSEAMAFYLILDAFETARGSKTW